LSSGSGTDTSRLTSPASPQVDIISRNHFSCLPKSILYHIIGMIAPIVTSPEPVLMVQSSNIPMTSSMTTIELEHRQIEGRRFYEHMQKLRQQQPL
jgi:hypothetical protein